MDVIQAAIGFIDAEFGVVTLVVRIRVSSEVFGINDLIGMSATHRKSVADHGPLRLVEKAKHLAHVVHQSYQYEPIRVSVGANGFGSLQQMLPLVEVSVGVGVVHKGIQKIECFPNRHLFLIEFEVFGFLFAHEIVRLVGMVQPIELPHRVAPRLVVVTVIFLGFLEGFRVAGQDVVFPYVETR